LNYGDTLFGLSSLSGFIGRMNKAIGIAGSINTLRHMKVSELLNGVNDTTERIKLAKAMGHSPITQLKYLRVSK